MGSLIPHISIVTPEEERRADQIQDELAPIAAAAALAASAAERAGKPEWQVMAVAREAAIAAAAEMEWADRRGERDPLQRERHNGRRPRRGQEEGA